MAVVEQYLVTPQTSAQIAQSAAAFNPEEADRKEMELKRARHYLTPSALAVLSYFVLSVAFLVASSFKAILLAFSHDSAATLQTFSGAVAAYGNNVIVSWLTIILFWGTVGLAVYTLFWLAMAFFTAARNELIVETAFSNRGHFWAKVRVPLIKLAMLGAIGLVLATSVRYVAPFSSDLFIHGFNHLTGAPAFGVGQIIASVLLVMFVLYLLYTLTTFFRHADGIF